MNYLIKLVSAGVGLAVLLAAINRARMRRLEDEDSDYPIHDISSDLAFIEKDVLKLEDVILWFQDNVEKAEEGHRAVLLKVNDEKQINREGQSLLNFQELKGKLYTLGFYNPQLKRFSNAQFVIADNIDEDLNNQFKDVDMIVFE